MDRALNLKEPRSPISDEPSAEPFGPFMNHKLVLTLIATKAKSQAHELLNRARGHHELLRPDDPEVIDLATTTFNLLKMDAANHGYVPIQVAAAATLQEMAHIDDSITRTIQQTTMLAMNGILPANPSPLNLAPAVAVADSFFPAVSAPEPTPGASPAEDGTSSFQGPDPAAGRYKMLKKIGKGAYGKVYLTYDSLLRKSFAMKAVKLNGRETSERIEEIVAEVRALASLSHGNVVRLYTVWSGGCTDGINLGNTPGLLKPSRQAITDGESGPSRSLSSQSEKPRRMRSRTTPQLAGFIVGEITSDDEADDDKSDDRLGSDNGDKDASQQSSAAFDYGITFGYDSSENSEAEETAHYSNDPRDADSEGEEGSENWHEDKTEARNEAERKGEDNPENPFAGSDPARDCHLDVVFGHDSPGHDSPDLAFSPQASGMRQAAADIGEPDLIFSDDSDGDYTRISQSADDGSPLKPMQLTRSTPAPLLGMSAATTHLFYTMDYHPLNLEQFVFKYVREDLQQNKDDINALLASHNVSHGHCGHLSSFLDLFSAILDGVRHIHARRYVHRDLKPPNILISLCTTRPDNASYVELTACPQCSSSGGNLALAPSPDPNKYTTTTVHSPVFAVPHVSDFGTAIAIGRAGNDGMGTTAYCPPYDRVVTPKFDVYSLGIMALEMVSGASTAYERGMVRDMVQKVPVGMYKEEVRALLQRGIDGMKDTDCETRWDMQDVKDWVEELRGLCCDANKT